ncbi:hypothetical protein NEHOM01_1363 [Nematocida homosporus]|uniref:uncharacterized protein n=1 Tax=Nematocida homosporus TaxID=1912981 RepID=UPI00221F44FE|nr:uncharacterized protein NEHOM01_1363 [Nematocida homosporus]KAI5186274.1 hypothetical protein NEHOM01_1363 [Nematocida homosporus]
MISVPIEWIFELVLGLGLVFGLINLGRMAWYREWHMLSFWKLIVYLVQSVVQWVVWENLRWFKKEAEMSGKFGADLSPRWWRLVGGVGMFVLLRRFWRGLETGKIRKSWQLFGLVKDTISKLIMIMIMQLIEDGVLPFYKTFVALVFYYLTAVIATFVVLSKEDLGYKGGRLPMVESETKKRIVQVIDRLNLGPLDLFVLRPNYRRDLFGIYLYEATDDNAISTSVAISNGRTTNIASPDSTTNRLDSRITIDNTHAAAANTTPTNPAPTNTTNTNTTPTNNNSKEARNEVHIVVQGLTILMIYEIESPGLWHNADFLCDLAVHHLIEWNRGYYYMLGVGESYWTFLTKFCYLGCNFFGELKNVPPCYRVMAAILVADAVAKLGRILMAYGSVIFEKKIIREGARHFSLEAFNLLFRRSSADYTIRRIITTPGLDAFYTYTDQERLQDLQAAQNQPPSPPLSPVVSSTNLTPPNYSTLIHPTPPHHHNP